MICASAPGSIMITGEHAVVYGHKAIVAAVEQRISVTLTPRQDDQVRITSESLTRLSPRCLILPLAGRISSSWPQSRCSRKSFPAGLTCRSSHKLTQRSDLGLPPP